MPEGDLNNLYPKVHQTVGRPTSAKAKAADMESHVVEEIAGVIKALSSSLKGSNRGGAHEEKWKWACGCGVGAAGACTAFGSGLEVLLDPESVTPSLSVLTNGGMRGFKEAVKMSRHSPISIPLYVGF